VLARARIRWNESLAALDFITASLDTLAAGNILIPCGMPRRERLVAALVEGWRGEICHVAITDPAGAFLHYKIKDPSFHNWNGLAMSMRNGQISDFPLCNKSFNLSYCGFDL
jgi:Ni,Fe-hydrogenase III large subunit